MEMNSVTRETLARIVKDSMNLSLMESYAWIEAFIKEFLDVIGDGYQLEIPGLGNFLHKVMPSRNIYDLKTKEQIRIASRCRIIFKPHPKLVEEINKNIAMLMSKHKEVYEDIE